jgi:hypothetical protein
LLRLSRTRRPAVKAVPCGIVRRNPRCDCIRIEQIFAAWERERSGESTFTAAVRTGNDRENGQATLPAPQSRGLSRSSDRRVRSG